MHANLRTEVQNVAYFQILQVYVSNRRNRTPELLDVEVRTFKFHLSQ